MLYMPSSVLRPQSRHVMIPASVSFQLRQRCGLLTSESIGSKRTHLHCFPRLDALTEKMCSCSVCMRHVAVVSKP